MAKNIVFIPMTGTGAPPSGTLERSELGIDPDSNTLYTSTDGTDIVALTGAGAPVDIPPDVVRGTPDGVKIEIVGALPGTPVANTLYFIT